MPFKFLIVEDHAIVRQGLRVALARVGDETSEIVEANSLEKAILCAGEHDDLDLVMLDLNLQDSKSTASLASFKKSHPDVPVIVFSGQDDPDLIREVFALGALGYVPKTSNTELIRHAVGIVLDGGLYLPPELIAGARPDTAAAGTTEKKTAAAPSPASSAPVSLQARQRDVLRLVNEGLSNKEISRQLGFSLGTTKNYMATLLRLFGVGSRSQLICLMRSNPGILDD